MITQETSVRKRDGRVVAFDAARISRAVANAFRAERELSKGAELYPELRDEIERTTAAVMARLPGADESVDVERIQDLVEEQLMRDGNYRVARRYIVYREEHKKARMFRGEPADGDRPAIKVRHDDGSESVFEAWRTRRRIEAACRDLEPWTRDASWTTLWARSTTASRRSRYSGRPYWPPAPTSRPTPHTADAAARLLLGVIYREAWGRGARRRGLR